MPPDGRGWQSLLGPWLVTRSISGRDPKGTSISGFEMASRQGRTLLVKEPIQTATPNLVICNYAVVIVVLVPKQHSGKGRLEDP